MSLKNKVIIVTGSSRGIGKAIAIHLANNNAAVIVNYSSSKEKAEDVVGTIEKHGGTAIAVKADVKVKSQVRYLFDQAIDVFGKVDVLVNNAGIMDNKLLVDSTDEDFRKVFDINVMGVLNTMQEAAEKLTEGGTILNLSSSTTKMMLKTYGIYSASKAAVEQMTRVFSQEVGRGITVNAIAPGGTETELFMQGKSDELIDTLKSMSPFNRLGQPDDIAKVVEFLCSDASQWISGQVIPVNGGSV